MRTLTLSKNLTSDINDMCIHNILHAVPLSQDYEELRDMTFNNDRFKLTVTISDRIPQCNDIIINILVKHILDLVDSEEDDTEEMNAFFDYVVFRYYAVGYFEDDEYLLKATTIEALEYVVKHINDSHDGEFM